MPRNVQKKKPFDPRRNNLIQRIHIGAHQLGMGTKAPDDGTYREMIRSCTGGRRSSTADCSTRDLQKILEHLQASGFRDTRPNKRTIGRRPRNIDYGDRAAQLQKIEALLTIGRLSWGYADAIAKRMKLADKVEWVDESQLHYIITALRKKAIKEGWDLSGEKQ